MNLTATHVHSDHGTVVLFDAHNDQGRPYVLAVDHRLAQGLYEAICEEGAVRVDAERWQVRAAR